jgi:MoaA/NifB/PqqE/SkfB family radical SAM enzyme
MKLNPFLELAYFGIKTVILRRQDPLMGSIILTDRCNLSCRHCAVGNITSVIYPYIQIKADMEKMYSDGIRILFLYGGEPFMWQDHGITLRDLVIEGKRMGFLLVNIVTNGTFSLDVPEADLIMVSLDGGREIHNYIRGNTYDTILENITDSFSDNICIYMAINNINKVDIETVCETARSLPNVKAVSFNFHTPYPGTEDLMLTREERKDCCDRIEGLIGKGYPILNLRSAFPYIIDNSFKTPCHQCIVMENGKRWTCGRCIEIPNLCSQCGFFFAAEFSLVFSGHVSVIFDMLRTYIRYI